MSSGNFTLFINKKWKNTDVYDALSKIQFRVLIDENLEQLDFKTNFIGICYLKNQELNECRRYLAKIHNIYQSLRLQALIEVTPQKQDLFKKLQEFAVVELKIQVIPVENAIEVAQYIERVLVNETQAEKNLFLKPAQIPCGNPEFMNCLKLIPKIGDKNAQQLAKTFKNLKAISNATLEELNACVGSVCAKSIYSYFHDK